MPATPRCVATVSVVPRIVGPFDGGAPLGCADGSLWIPETEPA